MKKGEILRIKIEGQRYPNEGIARFDNRKMKVDGALEGQTVDVRVLKSG